MARIAVVTSQVPGNANSALELVRRLRSANHEAQAWSPFDLSTVTLASQLAVRTIPPAVSVVRHPTSEPPAGSVGRLRAFVGRMASLRSTRDRRTALVEKWFLSDFVEALDEFGPDVVLIDLELPLHIMAASAVRRTVAVWTPHFSVWKRPGLPPLDSSSIPIRPGESDLAMEIEWIRHRSAKWARRQRLRVTRVGEDPVSVLKTAARQMGFDFARGVSLQHWFRPGVFTNLPLLSLNAFELEFPHEPHPTMKYLGPMLRPIGNGGTEADRLDRLVQSRFSHTDRRLIYCSFGTWNKRDDRHFYRMVFEAMDSQAEWDLLVGLGSRIDVADFQDVPENVHLFGFAPQREALASADLAIGHGGINTVNECLAAGVPMLLYPGDFMDQPGTAARMSFHGVAMLRDRTGQTPDQMRADISDALTDDVMLNRARGFQQLLGELESRRSAVAAIEALL